VRDGVAPVPLPRGGAAGQEAENQRREPEP
jgi:hypothetical protein